VHLLAQKVSLRANRSSTIAPLHEYSRPSAHGLSGACMQLARWLHASALAATNAAAGCTQRLWTSRGVPRRTASEDDMSDPLEETPFEGTASLRAPLGPVHARDLLGPQPIASDRPCPCLASNVANHVTEAAAGLNLLHIAVLQGDLHLVDSLLSLLKYSIDESTEPPTAATADEAEHVAMRSEEMAGLSLAHLASVVEDEAEAAPSTAGRRRSSVKVAAAAIIASQRRTSAATAHAYANVRGRAALPSEAESTTSRGGEPGFVPPARRDSRSLSPPKLNQPLRAKQVGGGSFSAPSKSLSPPASLSSAGGKLANDARVDAQRPRKASASAGAATRERSGSRRASKPGVHPAPSSLASPSELAVRGRWPGRGGGTVEDTRDGVHAEDLPGGAEVRTLCSAQCNGVGDDVPRAAAPHRRWHARESATYT
jgi:hypothetical protein